MRSVLALLLMGLPERWVPLWFAKWLGKDVT